MTNFLYNLRPFFSSGFKNTLFKNKNFPLSTLFHGGLTTTSTDDKILSNTEITSEVKQLPIDDVESQVTKEPVLRQIIKHPITSLPKQAWLETLSTMENKKLGLLELHSDVFGVFPRIDILWKNVEWQKMYRKIDYRVAFTRAEMRGGGRKPWRQKGTGRARHGSIRSPIFIGGGKVHGPRGPTSYFYMLPLCIRLLGLKVALTVKYAQGDLHIVDSLELPSPDPEYLKELIENRGWGLSVLFIDHKDIISKNMAIATSQIDSYTVMPYYGLNVHSLLKHETLVMTETSLLTIEERLLQLSNSEDFREKKFQRTRGNLNWQS